MSENPAVDFAAVWPMPAPSAVDSRRLFWTAGVGFAFLVGLVAVAATLGLLASNRIQDTAQELVRMHLIGRGGRQVEALIFQQTQGLLIRMVWVLGFCFFLAVLVSTVTLSALRRAFRQLARQEDELAKVSWHLLDIQEKMARRFSHEIHDELGQSLLGLRRILNRLPDEPGAGGAPGARQMATALVDDVVESARRLSQMLRPVILDDLGLDAGLRWLCETFTARTGIAVHYQSNFEGRLEEQEETHLFRIAQEALTNVARHAGARRVEMRLGGGDGWLELEVRDDGRGITEAEALDPGSLGIMGMRERAHHFGGEVEVKRAPGGGTVTLVRVPLGERRRTEEDEAMKGEDA